MFILNMLNKKPSTYSYNKIEVAYELFDTLSVGGIVSNPQNEAIVRKILLEYTDRNTGYLDREKILLKVIELAGDNNDSDSLYIKAMAYSWSKVKYNDLAVEYLRKYLNSGVSPYVINRNFGTKIPYENKVYVHLSQVYHELGDKLVTAYEYESALEAYKNMLNNDIKSRVPYGRQIPYLKIADTYRRMNNLDQSIKTLENAVYPNDCIKDDSSIPQSFYIEEFSSTINKYLKEYKEKKEKGYIFRPRKKED